MGMDSPESCSKTAIRWRSQWRSRCSVDECLILRPNLRTRQSHLGRRQRSCRRWRAHGCPWSQWCWKDDVGGAHCGKGKIGDIHWLDHIPFIGERTATSSGVRSSNRHPTCRPNGAGSTRFCSVSTVTRVLASREKSSIGINYHFETRFGRCCGDEDWRNRRNWSWD